MNYVCLFDLRQKNSLLKRLQSSKLKTLGQSYHRHITRSRSMNSLNRRSTCRMTVPHKSVLDLLRGLRSLHGALLHLLLLLEKYRLTIFELAGAILFLSKHELEKIAPLNCLINF